ncbi:hypothetical protein FHETE_5682 [Fusarium heterosporum]|uniref:NB-ARC domain-containing protein n=1 Tax=Fusarium heterosporum TaxID=42747 RepID=A0A8H5WRQ0_FUSHE|nr:hypothetical protein FHETE_5682 [Fusarium heterosporum]
MLSSLRRVFRGKLDQTDSPCEEASPSPSLKRQPTRTYSGIQVLHKSDHDEVDIVFVHGLKGDCLGTWKDRSTNEPWPKTLLPQEIKAARILTYSYDATVTGKGSLPSQNRISNHASTLLSALATLRQNDDTQRPEKHLQDIFNFTRGVIFLGTPHFGSSLAKIGELVSQSVGKFKWTNSDIIQVLNRDSEVLARIQDSFKALLIIRGTDEFNMIEITCFYEELPTKRLGCIVPKHSAILPGYTSIGIERNHAEMTKFSQTDEPGFVAICGELKRWIKKIQQPENNPQKNHAPVARYLIPYGCNPDFVGRSEILELLKTQLGHTGARSQRKAHFRASLHGLGGIGKTQIALAYSSWLQEAFENTSIFWVHASSVERFSEAYSNIAKECKIPRHEEPDFDALSETKAWLESKESGQWLMVVDNADDMQLFFPQVDDSPSSTSVKGRVLSQFIPECTHGTILITTRNMQVGSRLTKGKRPIKVGKMDEKESIQLLQQGLQQGDESEKDLLQLSSRLEFLPLALVQAAAFIQENSITVTDYLGLLDGSEDDLVELLNQEFEAFGRDSDTPRAVAQTWMLSFQQIERQYPFAGELLSLMCFFDRQAIPLEFLEFYAEEKNNAESNAKMRLVRSLGVLKAFCFIHAERGGDHNMHRLVQLVTRTWLMRKGAMASYARDAMLAVSDFYPYGHFEELSTCAAYLSHAFSVLNLQKVECDEDRLLRASMLHRVGGFFLFQGRYLEAEGLQREGLKIRSDLLGEEHIETKVLALDLSRSLRYQQKSEEAERLNVAVLQTWRRLYGEEDHKTLDAMRKLATIYYMQDKDGDAKSLYTRILEVKKRVLGEDHIDTIQAMEDLSLLLEGKEAERIQRHVVDASIKILGKDDPLTLIGMTHLSMTLYYAGETIEAEELQVQSLEASKRVLGEEHPSTTLRMMYLAQTWMMLGEFSVNEGTRHLYPDVDMFGDAKKLLEECVRLRTKVHGPDHPETLESILCLEKCQDAIERAEHLEVNDKTLGHNSQA